MVEGTDLTSGARLLIIRREHPPVVGARWRRSHTRCLLAVWCHSSLPAHPARRLVLALFFSCPWYCCRLADNVQLPSCCPRLRAQRSGKRKVREARPSPPTFAFESWSTLPMWSICSGLRTRS